MERRHPRETGSEPQSSPSSRVRERRRALTDARSNTQRVGAARAPTATTGQRAWSLTLSLYRKGGRTGLTCGGRYTGYFRRLRFLLAFS
jgi:hypothetical protein